MLSRRESDTASSWTTDLLHGPFQIAKDILDFIFPRYCVVTGERIPEYNSNPFVTDSILDSLEMISSEDEKELSSKMNSDSCCSLYRFSGECNMSRIIHAMKYSGFRSIGFFLGKILGDHFMCKGIHADILIPVPLHKARLRERGYNQSIQICRGISAMTGAVVIDKCVVRNRNTLTQTLLGREERASNVKDAFGLKPGSSEMIKEMNVVVVDDVITTGATINEIVKSLRTAGAGKITAGSVAMATGGN